MRAIGLLFAVSLLFVGCSSKYQRVSSVLGYYPNSPIESASGYFSTYVAQEPTRESGSASMHRATLRGYTVLGKRYYPQIRPIGWKEVGIASWYGPDFHGKKTSNGETYNMYAPGTAAHKTLPMNTIVLVTHRETGAQVKARINDRGPFVEGRIIDLSYTAGKAIGLDKSGTAPVTLEVLEYDAHIAAQLGDTPSAKVAAKTPSAPKPAAKESPKSAAIASEKAPPIVSAPNGAFVVQLGSFRNLQSADKLRAQAESKSAGRSVVIQTVDFGSEKLHRVLVGGFNTKDEAAKFKESNGFFSTAVVVSSS